VPRLRRPASRRRPELHKSVQPLAALENSHPIARSESQDVVHLVPLGGAEDDLVADELFG
jgi:hypothetical protein